MEIGAAAAGSAAGDHGRRHGPATPRSCAARSDRAEGPGERTATGDRFPGFNVLDQAGHWDPVTAGVVLSRVGRPPDIRFFTPAEEAAATALCDRLLGSSASP